MSSQAHGENVATYLGAKRGGWGQRNCAPGPQRADGSWLLSGPGFGQRPFDCCFSRVQKQMQLKSPWVLED